MKICELVSTLAYGAINGSRHPFTQVFLATGVAFVAQASGVTEKLSRFDGIMYLLGLFDHIFVRTFCHTQCLSRMLTIRTIV